MNRKVIVFSSLFICILVILIYHLNPICNNKKVLKMIDGQSGLLINEFVLEEEECFSINHLHSAQKVLVCETFRVLSNGKLQLVEMHFGSQGAGLPDANFGKFSLEGNNFYWRDINRIVPRINLRVGDISKPVLSVKGEDIDLLDLVGDRGLIIFEGI